jgi:alkylation response protein AidB-like acyl-CoA dehydrogenase
LRQMLGGSSFNEVLFDNATTPGDWIVGNRGDGWSVSRSTLTIERASISSPDLIDDLLRRLKQYARQTIRDGKSLLASDHYQQVFAKLEAHALAHRYSVLRQVSMDLVGEHPGVATLVNKLYGTDVGLKIAELAQDLIGDDGLLMPMEGATHENMDWPYWVMRSLAITIAGGASNIQRNIIGERGLGLPRDQMRRT